MIVYRYLCRMRPPAPGAVPKRNMYGCISGQIPIQGGGHVWGMVDYTEPLTDEEIDMYELAFAGTVDLSEEEYPCGRSL